MQQHRDAINWFGWWHTRSQANAESELLTVMDDITHRLEGRGTIPAHAIRRDPNAHENHTSRRTTTGLLAVRAQHDRSRLPDLVVVADGHAARFWFPATNTYGPPMPRDQALALAAALRPTVKG
jgi:hypothetical protein